MKNGCRSLVISTSQKHFHHIYIVQHHNTKLAAVLTKLVLLSNKNNLDAFLCMEFFFFFFGTKHRKRTLARYVVLYIFSHVLVPSVLHSNFHLKKVTTD